MSQVETDQCQPPLLSALHARTYRESIERLPREPTGSVSFYDIPHAYRDSVSETRPTVRERTKAEITSSSKTTTSHAHGYNTRFHRPPPRPLLRRLTRWIRRWPESESRKPTRRRR